MHTIGHVAYVIFLGIIALPQGSKHFLRYPSVKFTYTVNFLASVAGEGGHTETLVVVVRIGAAHADELIPGDTELLWIAAHVLAEETFVEVVVTCRHWSMYGVERRSLHQFQGFVERETFLHVVAQTLQVAEGCVTFVAVVDIFLDAEFLQQQHTTNTEQDFLLQAVLPVATIEVVGDGTVEL